jgi:hypothetical protein
MSVLAVVKVSGKTETFQKSMIDFADEYRSIRERAMGAGAIHHRFGIGDGYVLGIDEWETAEQFQTFFSDPSLQEFIAKIGGDPTPPEITITEAISSPDQF